MSFSELTTKAAELEVKLEELDMLIIEQDKHEQATWQSIATKLQEIAESVIKVAEVQHLRAQTIRSHVAALRGREPSHGA